MQSNIAKGEKMKTSKGVSYRQLLTFNSLGDGRLGIILHADNPLFNVSFDDIDKMIDALGERVVSGKKPAEGIKAQIARIEIHQEQLLAAYTKLFELYKNMSATGVTRQSPIDKARYEMLDSIMDMKLLRQMCAMYLNDQSDDYMLPDEKNKLIEATVSAMKTKVDTKVEV